MAKQQQKGKPPAAKPRSKEKVEVSATVLNELLGKMNVLTAQVEQYRKQVGPIEQTESERRAKGGAALIATGSVISGRRQDQIKEWCNTPQPDHSFFSQTVGSGIQLFPGYKKYDKTAKRELDVPCLYIKFAKWHGVGAEIPDPDNRTKRKFPFGFVDLSKNADVKRQTEHTLDEVIDALLASSHVQRGQIMQGEVGRLRIKHEFERQAELAAIEERQTAEIQAIGAHRAKAGPPQVKAEKGGEKEEADRQEGERETATADTA